MAYTYAVGGKKTRTEKYLRTSKTLQTAAYLTDEVRGMPLGLGEKDRSFMARAGPGGTGYLSDLYKGEPFFDSVRNDPKFQTLSKGGSCISNRL